MLTAAPGTSVRGLLRHQASALLVLGLAALSAQSGTHAQAADALPYSTGYLLTGNYAVGSVDLVPANSQAGSLSTGTIAMSGVPANADILAAFLYWQTIHPSSVDPRQVADSVQFRGRPIKSVRVKSTGQALTGNTGQCFASGSGAPLTLTAFRADVLRLLPPQLDVDGKSIGKLLVNDADLAANNLPRHTVTLPERGRGNVAPDSAGASLVVVYRDPALPLRKIVLYDGLHIATRGEVTTQTIRGFYQSAASKSATITHIAASGASNSTDVLSFNNSAVASNPFPDRSRSSDRSWGHVTVDVSALMSQATMSPDYGETVTSKVTHGKDAPYECLTWTATIFGTTLLDADRDGIPDRLEQPGGPLKDPDDVALPDLYAMGARTARRDFFVEVNAMRTLQETTYGSADAPYDSSATPPVVSVTAPPHSHMPTSDVIRMVGDALRAAPLVNLDGTTGIWPHADVGDIAAYHALGPDYAPTVGVNDQYLIPSSLARGGELTTETACDAAVPTCRFPDYPGTVGWGFSLTQYMFDKFDKNRNGLFHYLLYAHSRGRAKSNDPESGDFNVASSSSGVAHLPGNRAIVSLGRWENFVGTPYVQASTTFHEVVAHNGGLWHGGAPPTITSTPQGIVKFIEPNCKPNYFSVTNYAFQLRGLLNDAGNLFVDLSRGTQGEVREGALSDVPLTPAPQYRAAWYAPLVPGSLGATLGTPAAKKFCNGLAFSTPGLTPPSVPMGRIDAVSAATGIDWDALGLHHDSGAQDINLNGMTTDTLRGFDDWAALRLDQMGGGYLLGDVSAGGQDFGGQDFGGDGELTYEDAVAVAGAAGLPPNAFNACVLGGDLPAPRAGAGTPACADASSPLHRTRLTWTAPNLGTAVRYRLVRATGPTVTGASELVEVGMPTPAEAGCSAPGQVCTFVDEEALPDGRQFTYFAKADFSDGTTSGASNFATITARNDAPVALADARSTGEDTPLAATVAGGSHVLVNDSDADSPTLTPSLTSGTTNGTLVFNGDGSFIYTPAANFSGTDSFSYKLLGGSWPRDAAVPLSADSSIVTVTITVSPVNDPPSFTSGPDQTVAEDAGSQSLAWATGISAGPPNETDNACTPLDPVVCGQIVSFLVGNDQPALFADQPAVSSNGTLTYTPAPNANGTATVTVTAQDTGGTDNGGVDTSAAQTFAITVTPVNDQPGADSPDVGTDEDTPVAITLSAADIETPSADLSFTLTTGPALGELTGTWPNFIYTPDPNANGLDTFTFTVTDRGDPDNCGPPVDPACTEALTSGEATVAITINPVAEPLKILTLALPNGTQGVEYSQSVFASGGVEPYSWQIEPIPGRPEFTLPDGLSLSATTGLISGTPETASAEGFTFRVRVTDADGNVVTQDLCIHVDESTEGPLAATAAADTMQTTIDAIANELEGEGVEISNVSFTGVAPALGTFTGGFPSTGLSSGVILSSGAVENINGSNDSDSAQLNNGTPGDADLDSLIATDVNCISSTSGTLSTKTCDAAILEFDFTVTDPDATVVTFEYVFASEEYNEFVNDVYNDVFGFFMEGPDFAKTNLALIPGTSTPVSINTVNGGDPFGTGASNPSYYVNNDANDGGTQPLLSLIQADGLTKVLTVQATIAPFLTYHIKLAIADAGDDVYDSWVLIKTKSLAAVCPLIP